MKKLVVNDEIVGRKFLEWCRCQKEMTLTAPCLYHFTVMSAFQSPSSDTKKNVPYGDVHRRVAVVLPESLDALLVLVRKR